MPSQRTPAAPADARRSRVVGLPVDTLSPEDACRTIVAWAARAESRYVCVAGVRARSTAQQRAQAPGASPWRDLAPGETTCNGGAA